MLTIHQRAGEDGKLFGSVGAEGDRRRDPARPATCGSSKRKVRLEQPIREIGTFMVEIELADGAVASVKTIVAEEKLAPFRGPAASLGCGQVAAPGACRPGSTRRAQGADPVRLGALGAGDGRARGGRARRGRGGAGRPVRPHAADGARTSATDGEALIEAAPGGGADTVGVAVSGYAEAPRSETVLFNLLAGFLGSFALVRLSTWGIRDQLGAVPQRPASAAATSTTSCPGSCSPSPPARRRC